MAPRKKKRPSCRNVRNRLGNAQLETLIAYHEQHSLFARGQITQLGPQGHLTYQNMWIQLANQLNAIGPSKKDVDGWKTTWTKLRLGAKAKKAKFLTAFYRTGHEDPDIMLNEKDQRISDIYGTYGSGVNIGRELGFPRLPPFMQKKKPSHSYSSLVGMIRLNYPSLNLQKRVDKTSHVMNEILDKFDRNLRNLYGGNIDSEGTI